MGRCLEVIEVIVVIARDKKEAALEFLVPLFFRRTIVLGCFRVGLIVKCDTV